MVFLIKLSLAAVPAMIIVTLVWAILGMIFGGLIAGVFMDPA